MNRTCPKQAVAWAVALLCASLAATASAQTAPSRPVSEPDNDAERLPAVQITGTALRRIDAETALPVIVIRRAEIDRSGARTTTELLQQLPAMQGVVPTTAVVGTDSRGYASVSIHDLGDAYTLVLLNGQRVAPFGGQLSSGALSGVDINTIPLAMVDRIEVLTDGASALYGADALGGVVNIITRRDGDANEATIGWTLPKGGAREWRASAFKSVGSLDEQGQSLSLGASVMHRSALRATERGYASQSMPRFTYQGQYYSLYDWTLTSAPANTLNRDYSAGGNPSFNANGMCPAGQNEYFGLCLYNYAADLDLIPAQRQHSVMASYTRHFGVDSKLMVDALLSQSQVESHLAPSAATFQVGTGSPLYAQYLASMGMTDNPADVYYRFTDVGRRAFSDESTLLDLSGRMEGRHHEWAWRAGLKWSVSKVRSDIAGAMGTKAAQGLIDEGLINPFLLTGQQSASGLAAIQRQVYNGQWLSGQSSVQEFSWQASRDGVALPGGVLKWAVGANVRQERLAFSPSLFAQGLLSDPGAGTVAVNADDGDLRLGSVVPMLPSRASRMVWGGFSELVAPVLPELDLGGAVRFDHDQLSGSAVTGKTNLRWRPTSALMWRASVGTGFRTPNLQQLTAPGRSDGVTANKYDCTPALQALAASLDVQPCTGKASYPYVLGGNSQLQPEQSVQANLGVRVEPIAGHSLGLDLWALQIRNRIGTVDESLAFNNPSLVPSATWTTVPGNGSAHLALSGSPQNLGSLLSSGADIDASVRRAMAIGLIDSQLRASVILREDSTAYDGGPLVSNIGEGEGGNPTLKWRASWRNSLIRGGWTHSLTARYQSGYLDGSVYVQPLDVSGQPAGDVRTLRLQVSGQVLWDWQSVWRIDQSWQIAAGVINLFDTKPPFSLNQVGANKAQIVGYDERYFDARGRMLTLEARLSF